MKAFKIGSGVTIVLLTGSLVSCSQPALPTVEDDRRMDQALTRMKIEQKRTDEVQAQKQRAALDRMGQQPLPALHISDVSVLPTQPPMIQDQKAAPLPPVR